MLEDGRETHQASPGTAHPVVDGVVIGGEVEATACRVPSFSAASRAKRTSRNPASGSSATRAAGMSSSAQKSDWELARISSTEKLQDVARVARAKREASRRRQRPRGPSPAPPPRFRPDIAWAGRDRSCRSGPRPRSRGKTADHEPRPRLAGGSLPFFLLRDDRAWPVRILWHAG